MRGVRTSSRPRARTSTGPLTSQIHCEPLAQSRLGLSSTHEAGPQQSEPTQERTAEMVQQQSTRDAERRARPDSVRNGRTSPRVPVFLDLRGIWPPSRWSELPVGQPAQAGGTGRRPPAPPQSLGSAADGQPYKDDFRPWGHRSRHMRHRSPDSPRRSDAPTTAEPADGSARPARTGQRRSRALRTRSTP